MAKSNHPSPRNSGQTYLDEKTVREIVRNQSRQLELQENELKLRELDLSKGYEYATKTLNAQSEDLKNQRSHRRKMALIYLGAATVGILLTGWLIVFAIDNGEKELAINILSHVAAIIISAAGGFFAGKGQKQGLNQDQ